jgi:hypothetical protein
MEKNKKTCLSIAYWVIIILTILKAVIEILDRLGII